MIVIALLALVIVGGYAMSTREQRQEARAKVDKLVNPWWPVPVLLWAILLWEYIPWPETGWR